MVHLCFESEARFRLHTWLIVIFNTARPYLLGKIYWRHSYFIFFQRIHINRQVTTWFKKQLEIRLPWRGGSHWWLPPIGFLEYCEQNHAGWSNFSCSSSSGLGLCRLPVNATASKGAPSCLYSFLSAFYWDYMCLGQTGLRCYRGPLLYQRTKFQLSTTSRWLGNILRWRHHAVCVINLDAGR